MKWQVNFVCVCVRIFCCESSRWLFLLLSDRWRVEKQAEWFERDGHQWTMRTNCPTGINSSVFVAIVRSKQKWAEMSVCVWESERRVSEREMMTSHHLQFQKATPPPPPLDGLWTGLWLPHHSPQIKTNKNSPWSPPLSSHNPPLSL